MSTSQMEAVLALAPVSIGPALLSVEEDQWFDRKGPLVSAQALANLEVGLANADGGTIVIGLGKTGVEGTDSDSKHRNTLSKVAMTLTVPPVSAKSHLVKCINDRGQPDHLLVVQVKAGEIVHANQRDEVYLRVGDENRRLSFRLRNELYYDKGQTVFEASSVKDSAVGDLNVELLEMYGELHDLDDWERLLVARSLIIRKKLTVAAILLFGENPQGRYPEAYVRVLRYRGTERGSGAGQQLLRDVRCEGPIPAQIDRARTEIQALQPTRRALVKSVRFEAVGLIPQSAWLEGLVNAVVHRSYSLGGDHIRVSIFDDRIEIESPGRFPGVTNLAEPLNTMRFARNPRIARVCSDLNLGQELGEGIRRMFQEMRMAGLPDPSYHQSEGGVRLTLHATSLVRELESRLPHRSTDILLLLQQASQMRTGDVADAVGLSRPATLVRLRALKDAGLIEWVGESKKDPRAVWRLVG